MKIKVLLIGLGQIGYEYDLNKSYNLTHFSSFYNNKKFSIIGVCDVDKKKKIFFTKKNINFFTNYKEALKLLNPDLIVISTPTKTHFNLLKDVIKLKGVRLILCEKPFCSTLSQAKKIKNLDTDNKIFVNYMRSADFIFYNYVIKKIIKEKKLNIQVFYTGSLLNMCSHYISLLQKYLGKCKKIYLVKRYNSQNKDFKINFKDNIEANFISSSAKGLNLDKIEFITPNKIISYINGGHLIYLFNNKNNPIYSKKNYYKQNLALKNKFYENSQLYIVKEIYNFFQNKKNSLCSASEAIQTHQTIESI